MYDLIVVGGGPAGVAAGVYAARKKLKLLFIADSFGGQSLVSAGIQNWIGTVEVSGFDFAKMLENHLRAQEGIEILEDRVIAVSKIDGGFKVGTQSGKIFETKTMFVASGSRRRRLGVPGEDRLDGKGVAFCSICDAPVFAGQDVAVVGGGNAGLEAVVDLIPYANKIYIMERNDSLKGDAVTQEKIKVNNKVNLIFKAETQEILGDQFVSGIKYKDLNTGEIKELKVGGVFVEIGSIPNSDFLRELVELNKFGEVIVDPKTQITSLPGIWAAGDITDGVYKQNNIAAGDAVKAVLSIWDYLQKV